MKVAGLGAGEILGRSLVKRPGERARPLSRRNCDVTREDDARRATEGVTLVVNCAAWTDVHCADKDEEAAFRANAIGAENAANLRAQHVGRRSVADRCAGETTGTEFGRTMAKAVGVVPYWDEVAADTLGHSESRPKKHLLARRMLGLHGLDRLPDWSWALMEYLKEAAQA